MEIAAGVVLAALLAALLGLGWFYLGAREGALRARAELDAMRRGLDDAERLREANLLAVREAAKSASLEVAAGISSKLLDDHKRESDAVRKETRDGAQAINADLVKQVQSLADMVAGLNAQLKDKGETVDMLKRVLENPAGAGAVAEIGLANTLKSFGLENPRDYVLQYTTEDAQTGRRLRPDAVVFLPGDNLLVIDCKASKFLFDIARAEGGETEAEAYDNLRRTMNQHLRALLDKDYRSAIFDARRDAGPAEAAPRILMMMFLPNNAAVEKLARADAGFRERARAAEIIVGGPDVLYSVLSVASAQINLARQAANHEHIIARTRLLLDGIAMALAKADDVGQSIRRAAKSFDDFSRSTNRSLLPRARALVQLGVQPGKPVPGNLPAFSVHTEDNIIDGEAEELEAAPPTPRLVK